MEPKSAFKVGTARILGTPTMTMSALGTSFFHTFKFRNQGLKRTAILGYDWKLKGFQNSTSLQDWVADIGGSIKEYAPNRKERSVNLPYESIYTNSEEAGEEPNSLEAWNLPRPTYGHINFPWPILVKNADVSLGFAQSEASQTLLLNMDLFVANAELEGKDDLGDYTLSVLYNKGRRRSAQKGETRIALNAKGGVRY